MLNVAKTKPKGDGYCGLSFSRDSILVGGGLTGNPLESHHSWAPNPKINSCSFPQAPVSMPSQTSSVSLDGHSPFREESGRARRVSRKEKIHRGFHYPPP